MLTPRAHHCANLILAAHHVSDDWAKNYEPQEAEDMREDAAIGLAAALQYLARTSSPAAQFELETLAVEIDPEETEPTPPREA